MPEPLALPSPESALLAEAGNLSADTPALDITLFLGQVAAAELDALSLRRVLEEVKRRTRLPIAILTTSVGSARRDLDRADSQETFGAIRPIRDRYVYIKQINAMWDRDLREVVPLDAVRNAHWSEMPVGENDQPFDPADVLVKGRLGAALVVDKVDAMRFLPGGRELMNGGATSWLNIWERPAITPAEGDVGTYLEHLDYLLDGNIDATEWLLDWCAHLVQRPEVKIFSTVLIIGEHGIGKSILGVIMSRILGASNVNAIERSNLLSTFNEWMDGCQLVILNELWMGGGDRQEAMDRLKSYITDPEIRINRKNVPSYKYENRANFLMFSNKRDAATIEQGDRRYFIHISQALPKDETYYIALIDWINGQGAAAVLDFLQKRDLSRFNPAAPPPITTGKAQVMADSRNPIDAYFAECLESSAAPFRHDLITVNRVVDYMTEVRKMRITHRQVVAFLREIGAEPLGQVRNGRERLRLWAIREGDLWAKLSDGDLIMAWREIPDDPMSDATRAQMLGKMRAV